MTSAHSTRAQDDLFRHVNGDWLDHAEIPADQSMYGAFNELRDDAELAVRGIIEKVAAGERGAAGSAEQLIGDLYSSFMDTEAVEAVGVEPIRPTLAAVAEVSDLVGLFTLLGKLDRDGVGGAFGFYVDTDPAQPDRYTLALNQGGLGLPDESYYREEQYADIRKAYAGYADGMLELLGLPDSAALATRILDLETEIAAGHWDRVRNRDRDQTNNPMDRAGLADLLPAAWWEAWLSGMHAPVGAFDHVIVRQPSFFTAVAALLSPERLDDWKAWLSLRVIRSAAPMSIKSLVEKNFDFYGRTLSGTPELRERWKRGTGFVEGSVGEALGELYVQQYFPPAAKGRMDELVDYLIRAYRQEIEKLPWMSAATKEKALEKLAAFTPKVGYPSAWRDYSALVITPGDLLGNARRVAAFEHDRELAKIGKPVDREEWFMTPQTVNAYYNPGMNEIVFPAAILRPPFFDLDADDAVNFGGIGAVIGHEIGHGFDDQGSKYDGTGALNDWWTAADREAFEALTAKLIAQYSELEPADAPGHRVNGGLTIGENIGDLGGLGIAYQAWLISLNGQEAPVVDGVTGAQRFFLSWATVWRAKGREAEVLRRLAVDPHSPPEFRCNQVVRNMDEFYDAFEVAEGDALWLSPEERVRIW
ncbi:peptidase M13 [Nakamurella antarctica]|uniref:Peptidase M13 n=1 Tax=Nakamurella antarctica TaxID=1902245 RepID=A0A3G8ZIG4_9ACTN|nr:M13-type metalloendopeptidase [Nakamurella antarctica]AZI57000.1 peptidase M13 [Nakamurella antarctica]